jgi:hypothetical protein
MPRRSVNSLVAFFGASLTLASAPWLQAQAQAPGAVQGWSSSGQFLVSALPAKRPRSRLVSNLETNRNFLRLDATLLPVSCERIKQIVIRQLELDAGWTGKIFLSLYPASSGQDAITISPRKFRDGWRYGVELPDLVERFDFVRAVVHVVLLEAANRQAGDRGAEIPPWLNAGLCQQVLMSSEVEIILQPPRPSGNGLSLATTVMDVRKQNPLAGTHDELCASAPLTFQQLSWPSLEQLEGDQAAAYRASAQLFVAELIQLADGRDCLRAMLTDLPQHYNWQFAFLYAFRGHFRRPLDVEKWWALQLEHFTGRDLTQTWPPEESWQKLDEVLRSAVQVRAGTNDLPLHAQVKLQTIIREWDGVRQTQALQFKLRELEILRLRLASGLAPLADEYYQALILYLQAREQRALPFLKKASQRRAAEQVLRELDALDVRRLDARPGPKGNA